MLSSALDPQKAYESFRVSDICSLVDDFYPIDFTNDENNDLKKELDLYKYDVVQHSGFKNLKNISELCQWVVRTRKSEYYLLIYSGQACAYSSRLYCNYRASIFSYEGHQN